MIWPPPYSLSEIFQIPVKHILKQNNDKVNSLIENKFLNRR